MSTIFHPRHHAVNTPDKLALIIADAGEALNYASLVANADRAAQLLRSMGLHQGDTIAIFLENQVSYAELCWAAKNSGITYVCIGSQSSVEDAAYIVENSDAKALITSVALSDVASRVIQTLASPPRCLMVGGAREPFEPYESLLGAQSAVPLTGRRRGPSMLYSSGTTGRPKGVRTSLPDEPPESPPRRLAMLRQTFGLAEDTVLVSPGPLYHAAPGRFMMSVQRVGGTVVSFRKFDAEATLRAIEEFRATHCVLVPTMFIRMLALPLSIRSRYDLSSLRSAVHMAAPCPITVKEQMIDWWGPIIDEMYSGTEAVGHTIIRSREWLAHKGSVGCATDGCEIRILDENGVPLPPLEPGQIYMRNGHRFEYHKDPDKTDSAYAADGWATLGDIGYLDKDNYLYLTDRKANMIISAGVNIYPQEAENVLLEHPAVADVAVIGVPHPEYGEQVKAVVELKQPADDEAQLASELIDWCRSHLTKIKCPRSVDFVKSLPRNESGKLMKRLVKESYWSGRDSIII
jgi:long-chain acyl-CoA synthetase